jgi:hypothetical protein
VAVQRGPAQRLRQHVGRVLLALDLVKIHHCIPDQLLDPQLAYRKMPHAPDACAATNANGRRGIGAEGNPQLDAKVPGYALQAKGLAGGLDDAAKFGFSAAQRDRLLSRRPVLHELAAPQRTAA